MLVTSIAADVSIDAHVIRRIGEHHPRPLALEQPDKRFRLKCVTADHTMSAKLPDIARLRDHSRGAIKGRNFVSGIGLGPLKPNLLQAIDIDGVKARDLNLEIKLERA